MFPWLLIGCLLTSGSRNADTPSRHMELIRHGGLLTEVVNTQGESHTRLQSMFVLLQPQSRRGVLLTHITELLFIRKYTVTDIHQCSEL